MTTIELPTLMCVAPKAVEQAQRLQYAILLLRRNTDEHDVRQRVQRHYHCSKMTAWRTVNMAKDIV
jgi:hypothetical protein